MKKPLLCLLAIIFISSQLFSQAANNTCATATNIGTLTGNFTATPGDLYLANTTALPTGSCAGGARNDVWYKFTLPATSTIATITVVLNSPSGLSTGNTFIELFNTSTCNLTSTSTGTCNNISQPRKFTGLTAGGTYCFRVYTTLNPNTLPSTNWGFNVYVMPFNDNCNNVATILQPGSTLDGNVFGATSSGVAVGTCTGNPDDDVWYSFTALYSYATITLHAIGSDLSAGGRMQLFSGTCGGVFTAIGCSNTSNVINATGLTPNSVYYVRVYSFATGQGTFTYANSGFKISLTPSAQVVVGSGRMKEVYQQQIISAPEILADPWEVTYGPDGNLWVTESKGYRLYRINPTTGVRDTVLNISQGSTFFSAPADVAFNAQFNIAVNNPQGGFAGLALHPKFLDATSPKNYIYVSYVHSFVSTAGGCSVYVNRVVRFTYNTGTNRLESPVSLCDTLPGGNDHNSQRMYIAPVTPGGTNYLFYAQGDMGGGQLSCAARAQKAQLKNSYEGKILRFNLEPDADGGLNAWIPSGVDANPFNALLGVQSAVWVTGIRNNQGFAYDTALNILYGSSHGPYSDDEINIIESGRNYGHPSVIGFAADNNYNNASAGTPRNSPASTCPIIGNEVTNAATIGATYKDPLFSAYPSSPSYPSIYTDIWNQVSTPNNGFWPSEAWSGLDLYTHTIVPGWKRSLVAASLKWGRLVRLKLGSTGTTTLPSNLGYGNVGDTISYFGSQNRFRDLAFDPNGKDIYVIMDRSTTTSGPSALFPVVPSCKGCLQKYTFLGYADAAGKSTIPTSIDVTDGTVNTCNTGTTITIDNTNNNLWVPITGPDGNIMAEIYAMNQNLGVVTSSFFKNSGPIRVKSGVHYLDRNMTITPAVTSFATPVKVRLYISKAEFDALDADPLSGITTGIGQLNILKNSDPCSAAAIATTTIINPTNTGVDLVHGANGYVLQANISGFSSFYFGVANITLPVELVYFKGSLQSSSALLQWETINENNTSYFDVERSIDGRNFDRIGAVAANGNSAGPNQYSDVDNDVTNLSSAVIYYRLKMVDRDGQYKYSSIVTIYLADITGRIVLSPNPAADETKVMITATLNGKAQWKLVDNNGRVIMHNAIHIKRGSNNFTINVSSLSAGLYFLKITGAGIDQNVKLQKL